MSLEVSMDFEISFLALLITILLNYSMTHLLIILFVIFHR